VTARARKTGEKYRQYRKNLKAEGEWLDRRCNSGRLLWDVEASGNYVRKKHGDLGYADRAIR
jgi:hypothetical protein